MQFLPVTSLYKKSAPADQPVQLKNHSMHIFVQKKEHEKENSIKIAFYCKLFGGCVQPVLQ